MSTTTTTTIPCHVVTPNGNAQHDTAQSKFGSSSILFDGAGDYLSIPNGGGGGDDWNFNFDDFTIDFWIRPNTLVDLDGFIAVMTGGGFGWRIDVDGTTGVRFDSKDFSGNPIVVSSGASAITTGAWQHIAVTRTGNVFRIFVDGVEQAQTTNANDVFDNNQQLVIGRRSSDTAGNNYDGWMEGIRIINGTSLWSSNFTPPTAPPVPIANGVLIIDAEDSDASTTFVDLSCNPAPTTTTTTTTTSTTSTSTTSTTTTTVPCHVVTTVGNTQHDTAQSKFGSSSILFDGAGDYLTVPSSSDFDFGTGEFTVDFWVRPNTLANFDSFFGSFQVGSPANTGWVLLVSGTTNLRFIAKESATAEVDFTTSGGLSTGSWQHVAVTRVGNTIKLWIDGVFKTSAAHTHPINQNPTGGGLRIGRLYSDEDNWYYDGWMEGIRITKGVARWDANFTPPAAPPFPEANVTFLMDPEDTDTSTNFFDLSCNEIVTTTSTTTTTTTVTTTTSLTTTTSTTSTSTTTTSTTSTSTTTTSTTSTSTTTTTTLPGTALVDELRVSLSGASTTTYLTSAIVRWSNDNLNWNLVTGLTTAEDAGADCAQNIAVLKFDAISARVLRVFNSFRPNLLNIKAFFLGSEVTAVFGRTDSPVENADTTPFFLSLCDEMIDGDCSATLCIDGTQFMIAAQLGSLPSTTTTTTTTTTVPPCAILTPSGNAQHDTAQAKFDASSILLDGTDDFIRSPQRDDWDFGSLDFTIDFWLRPNIVAANDGIMSTTNSASTQGWRLWLGSTGGGNLVWDANNDGGTSLPQMQGGSGSIVPNVWQHCAIVRRGAILTMYVGGVEKDRVATILEVNDSIAGLMIGKLRDIAGFNYDGWIDAIRITRGRALWTAPFTPPGRPFNEAHTTLLINPDGIDGTNTFLDESCLSTTTTTTTTTTTLPGAVLLDQLVVDSKFGDSVTYALNLNASWSNDNISWFDLPRQSPSVTDSGSPCSFQITIDFQATAAKYFRVYSDVINKEPKNISGFYLGLQVFPVLGLYDEPQAVIDTGPLTLEQCQELIDGDCESGATQGESPTLCASGQHNMVGMQMFEPPFCNPIERNNGIAHSTTQAKFGGSSIGEFGQPIGTEGITVIMKNGNDLNFGFDDFTIELWMYPTVFAGNNGFLTTRGTNPDIRGWVLDGGAVADKLRFITWEPSFGQRILIETAGIVLTLNQWQHVAVTRSGNTFRLFVDGVQVHQEDSSFQVNNFGHELGVGRQFVSSFGQVFSGFMEEIRISKGVARWTSSFSPFAAPYTIFGDPDTFTKVLIESDTFDGDTNIVDISCSGVTTTTVPCHLITVNGQTKHTTAQQKFGATSVFFDGVGDWLQSLNDPTGEWNLGTADMTVDLWIRPSDVTGNRTILSATSFSPLDIGWYIEINAGKLKFFHNNGTISKSYTETAFSITVDIWQHISFKRVGTQLMFTRDGIQGNGSTIGAFDNIIGNSDLTIGQRYGDTGQTHFYLGYMDDIRISTARRWIANFVPPDELHTQDANTHFLLRSDTTEGSQNFEDFSCFALPPSGVGVVAEQTWANINHGLSSDEAAFQMINDLPDFVGRAWQALNSFPLEHAWQIINSMLLTKFDAWQMINHSTEPAEKAWQVTNNITPFNRFEVAWNSRNSLGLTPIIIADEPIVDWKVEIDNIDVTKRMNAVDVTIDEDTFVNTFELRFTDITIYDKFQPESRNKIERVVITIKGDVYKFLLEEGDVVVEVAKREFSFWGRSRPAILGKPYSDEVIVDFEPAGLASEIIARYTSAEGLNLTFSIDDYNIADLVLFTAERTPLQIITEVAEAGGGIVRSDRVNRLIVRKKYPDLNTINTLVPDQAFTDLSDIVVLNQQELLSQGLNAVLVEGNLDRISSLSGRFELDFVRNGGKTSFVLRDWVYLQLYLFPISSGSEIGKFRVGLYPADTYFVDVSEGSFTYRGTIQEDISREVVEIVNGEGTLDFPALAITAIDWLGTDIGQLQLDFIGDNRVSLIPNSSRSVGIVAISYQTEYDSYLVSDTTESAVLTAALKDV